MKMNKKLIVGNMKMNPVSPIEADRYLNMLEKELSNKDFSKTEVVVCPPVIFLDRFVSRKLKLVKLGSQDAFWERNGAFTGEVSAAMVKSTGGSYVIVGHSERRHYFNENDSIIALKLKAAFKNGLKAILCVGETEEEKKRDQIANVLKRQLKNSLKEINQAKLDYLSIAYEPVWAIGTNRTPTSDEILEAKLLIKKTLAEMYGQRYMNKIRILYGGSVKSNLVVQTCLDPAMDGVLVGRESLMPYEFLKIAELVDEN